MYHGKPYAGVHDKSSNSACNFVCIRCEQHLCFPFADATSRTTKLHHLSTSTDIVLCYFSSRLHAMLRSVIFGVDTMHQCLSLNNLFGARGRRDLSFGPVTGTACRRGARPTSADRDGLQRTWNVSHEAMEQPVAPGEGGGGGGEEEEVLPHSSYTGMCQPTGSWVWPPN